MEADKGGQRRTKPAASIKVCLACGASPVLLCCTRCKNLDPEAPFEAPYCNQECQAKDWKRHKGECKLAVETARARRKRLNRLLWNASLRGEVPLVQGLIAQGAEVDWHHADQNGFTALHAATQQGKVAVVDALIAAGCQVEAEGSQGIRACYIAAELNQVEVLRRLIRAGADVNRAASHSLGSRPLGVAAAVGNAAVIDCLLAAGALVDARCSDGGTALVAGSQEGKLEAVRSLIRGGANVNLISISPIGYSVTALMQASKYNHPSVVETLLEAGADANFASPESGGTALMLACYHSSEGCVRTLLAGGADPRMVSHEGHTALGFAKHKNHPAIAALIEAKLRELSVGGGA